MTVGWERNTAYAVSGRIAAIVASGQATSHRLLHRPSRQLLPCRPNLCPPRHRQSGRQRLRRRHPPGAPNAAATRATVIATTVGQERSSVCVVLGATASIAAHATFNSLLNRQAHPLRPRAAYRLPQRVHLRPPQPRHRWPPSVARPARTHPTTIVTTEDRAPSSATACMARTARTAGRACFRRLLRHRYLLHQGKLAPAPTSAATLLTAIVTTVAQAPSIRFVSRVQTAAIAAVEMWPLRLLLRPAQHRTARHFGQTFVCMLSTAIVTMADRARSTWPAFWEPIVRIVVLGKSAAPLLA